MSVYQSPAAIIAEFQITQPSEIDIEAIAQSRGATIVYPDFEDCLLVEPLCQLLLGQPELSLEPRRPGAWAKLLRGGLAGDWDGKRPPGSGVVGRCFGRHRHVLEQRLDIIKTKRSAAAGWYYQLRLRPEICGADHEFQRIQGESSSITGAEAVTCVAA